MTETSNKAELADLLLPALPLRIHALQLKEEKTALTQEERSELERLQTEWSNRCLSPTEYPVRRA